MRIDAILFDWDNTLLSSREALKQALQKGLDHYKVGRRVEDLPHEYLGGLAPQDFLPQLFGDPWKEAHAYIRAHYMTAHMIPTLHAEEVLTECHRRGYPIGVVSNKEQRLLLKEVDAHGWGHFFTHVVGAEEGLLSKPHPDPIMRCLEAMGCTPSESVWFVGDSIIDMQAARAAGCTAIWFNELGGDSAILKQHIPHRSIATLPELFSVPGFGL